MAEEQLNLIDNMSPSLRRIYQEAEKLNKRMLTLRSNIKALEKPMSLSYMRRELKSVENQAKQTERALKQAVRVGEREGILSWNARYGGIQHHTMYGQKQYIKDADLIRYGQYLQNAQLRRNRMLYNTGRYVNGLSFDERLARLHQLSTWQMLKNRSSEYFKTPPSMPDVNGNFLRLAATIGLVTASLRGMYDVIHDNIIKAGDEFVGGITRVALTSDKKYQPTEMMSRLYDTAIRTRADSEGTISLYNRIAMSGVKASNDRILRFVETFNKTMAISGTTAQENRAVMLQLAQGMGSNRLGGDEFRSIAEQAPMFKYMLARGMGVNPGALKQMGADGKLTAEAIMQAMEKVQGQIDDIFKHAPWTIGQLLIIMQDKWQKVITQNITGYIKLRDLVKDFVNWLDTANGEKFIYNIVDSINYLLTVTTSFMRRIAPVIIFLLNHLKEIYKIITIIGGLWVWTKIPIVIKTISTLIQTLAWGMIGLVANVEAFITTAITGFTSLAGILGLTVGQLGAVAAGIITIVGAMLAFKHIKDELDPEKIRLSRQQKDARYQYERNLDDAIRQRIGTKPTFMSAAGHEVKLTAQEQRQVDNWNKKYLESQRQKQQIMNQWDLDAKQGVLRKFSKEDMLTPEQKALRDVNKATSAFYGKMNSMENKPMPIESKKGKLDSVGRIDEDINLNTDSIQMMKAIAERQWIVQNEVMVPQKVEMNVDKSTNMDPNSIAEVLNTGMQLAIASSMRGEAIA